MRSSVELISRSFSLRYPGIPSITFLSPGSDPLSLLLCWLQGEPQESDQLLGVDTSLEQLSGACIPAREDPCLLPGAGIEHVLCPVQGGWEQEIRPCCFSCYTGCATEDL